MKWKQWRIFFWVKWGDTLKVVFDGNRVTITGPWFHVHRLPRILSKYGRS